MRSVQEDLTAVARIRDAALSRFAATGYSGTSIRAIAADAGVSAALVIHHFGSKEALRSACDDHLLDHITGSDLPHLADTAAAHRGIRDAMGNLSENRVLFAYLGRMLTDGGPVAEHLFDRLVALTRHTIEDGAADGTMRSFDDPEVLAVVLTAQGLANLVLGAHVARSLGVQELDPPTVGRMALPLLELYTHGLYSDDTILTATRAALRPTEGSP
ncbi:TetR family transcriptional regulator [Arthrobacter agilis]|uniref:TetR family transcriptional regulator n=1 Tax=Arthrobacter agilis TaxID=37921 RepID=UPI002366E4D0|nr:TetR family transcriptional regulator [Arthrobacter agilis]WDF33412.1 TetR family transcriptional regulator [Arthrobacter agilis]